ncbi:TetR/AcrR family transcriptional regulator [bacterium]|nr:MAG: TetR/AcrR family transcriptional regulator [bacterium]
MSNQSENIENELSTEEKIKQAARVVFHKKGFAATRTRDIAEEAGINLALLNYYFRSKEKLFQLIMAESLSAFIKSIATVFNDESTTLYEKIPVLVDKYIDMLTKNPTLPIFILGELQQNPDLMVEQFSIKQVIMQSVFMRQFQAAAEKGEIAPMQPIHFVMNVMGFIVFPFVASPMLRTIGDIPQDKYIELMHERKKMIPEWIRLLLKPSPQV